MGRGCCSSPPAVNDTPVATVADEGTETVVSHDEVDEVPDEVPEEETTE